MPISEIGAVSGSARHTSTRLTLRRPDDWHVHLRDGAMLAYVVNYTARQYARAIVMPISIHRSRPSRPRRPIETASSPLLSRAWSSSP